MNQPQTDWDAVRLYYCECRSYKEAAAHFGLTVAAVKKRATRGKWSGCSVHPREFNRSAGGTESASVVHPEETRNGSGGTESASVVHPEGTSNGSEGTESASVVHPEGPSNGSGGTESTALVHPEGTSNGAGGTESTALVHPEGTSNGAGGTTAATPSIPANINLWSRREAAIFYHRHLGWAIHHLHAFDQGTEKQKGKKPLMEGWPDHTAAQVSRKYIDSHFGAESKFNLGVVLRPPYVAVDLDSKPDSGESVRTWMASQPELAAVPRERTAGGAHLHFRCPDLPETVLTFGKAITADLASGVTAELYVNGLNLVLSPSLHKTGHLYTWEVTGGIPEVKWADLVRWFGFAAPARKKRGRRWDPSKWWLAYEGDLHTLDAPGLCGELGWLGDCLDPDEGKWAVLCPWSTEHSEQDPNAAPGSDTVIFESVPTRNLPGFKCLHAHCAERTIEQFLAEAEKMVPGIVNRRCVSQRERGPVKMEESKLPPWLVPDGSVKLATESIRELGELIAPSHSMFVMNTEVVRLLDHRRQPYCTKRKDDETRHDFAVEVLHPVQLITAIESFCRPTVLRKSPDGELEAFGTVLKRAQAEFTIASSQFAGAIPHLKRVLRSPVPSPGDRPGELLFPEPGYNPATGMFLSLDAVRALPLPPTPENIAWAKAALAHLLAYGAGDSFAYASAQDECHSFARFLTPFCRGLMDWCKGPVWTFEADDPGTGKDTLADLTHVQQTGAEVGYSPTTDVEEMRKTLTSFLLGGGSFFHIGNVRGVFKCAPFEAATAASRIHQDRLLGQNKPLRLRNEAEYSFSANDAVFTPDILRRCRRIFQRWKGESVNNRVFRIRGVIGWTFRNRSLLATAALTLIQAYWRDRGSAPSQCEFSSFPEWADIVGGLCLWAGFGNPTKDHLLDAARRDIGAPDAAEDRYFLKLLHEHTSGDWIKHGDAMTFAEQHGKEALPSLSWDRESTWRRQMGRKLAKLVDKERGPYVMERKGGQYHQSRAEYRVAIRAGHSPDEEAVTSAAFTGDWFQAPAVPCLDQAGNLAVPGRACRPSPCAFQAPASSSPPVMPVFPFPSNPLMPPHLIEEKKEENGIRCTGIYSTQSPVKTGKTGAPASEGPAQAGADAPTLPERRLCSTRADLDRIIDDLIDAPSDRIALDLETYGAGKGDGLDPWRGDVRLLTLRREGGPVWMLDLMATGYDLGSLGSVLESATLIVHNAKFDLLWLRVKCGLRLPKVFCTLTAARLLTAGTKPGNNLDQCLERYLGVSPGPDLSRSDWGAMFLTDDQIAYAARDVAHLHDLATALEEEIEKAGLERVWALESSLLPRVVEMEAAGIRVDVEKLRSIAAQANTEAARACADLREALGNPALNPASPAQLLAALQSAGIQLESTAEDALKAADDGRIIPMLLTHREASKRAQQAEALIGHVRKDGRIHARFEPTGTATGRFSSKEPNLQNIGRGELREAFVPEPGHKLIVADYSQVELRAAAAIAGETKMIEAYRGGADLHRKTAATVLGKPEAEVTKGDRQLAKACFSGDTEILTPQGWVRFDSYDGITPVAQFELPEGFRWNPPRPRSNRWGLPTGKLYWDGSGTIQFVRPLGFESFPCRELYHNEDRNTDLLLTGDHEVAFITNTGNPAKRPALEVTTGNCRHLVAAGVLPRPEPSERLELFTRCLAMVVADGYFASPRSVHFGFSKERKVKRCLDLLQRMGLEPRVSVSGRVTTIRVSNDEWVDCLLSWITLRKDLSWRCLTELPVAIYLDEAAHWDSHLITGQERDRALFCTTSRQTAEVMQAMAATSGHPSLLSCTPSSQIRHSDLWHLSYVLRGPSVWRASWSLQPTGRRERVWCVQVPSGAILIRRNGKVCVQGNCNFGLIYGQSAPGLVRYAASSYGVHLAADQAQQIRAAFFRTYGQLRQWHGLSHQQAEKGVTEVRTRLGRRRLIPSTAGEWERFTALVNTPVQGGCADGMKQAIALLAGRLPEGARILSTVHDELIVEAPENQAEAVCELVATTMREAMGTLFPEVPIEVEAGTCNHWGEK